MVFLGSPLWRVIRYAVKTPNPDRFWKKRKILTLSAHFRGRKQNIYKFAVNHVRRALRRSSLYRQQRAKDNTELQIARLSAACEEHGFNYYHFKQGLNRSDVLLNKKVLCDLAIWEPRTFKSLLDFSWKKCHEEGLNGIQDFGDPPSGVILKPMVFK